MKKILIFSTILALFILTFSTLSAKRVLPKVKTGSSKASSATRGVLTSVKFRSDRRAIAVTFSNLGIASSVSYTLSYNTRGTTQGATGTINTATSTNLVSRELLFGTCSKNVCRYDSSITNAKFVVTTVLKNGKKVAKTFRLRV